MSRSTVPPNYDHQDRLNRCLPAANSAQLGNILNDLITQVNALTVKFNALLAKLDADAANSALNDTNYASTLASGVSIKTLANR